MKQMRSWSTTIKHLFYQCKRAAVNHYREVSGGSHPWLQGLKWPMNRWLLIAGIVLVVLGLAWPIIVKLGLGSLPGDIRIERDGYSFYFPITTGLIVSIALSLFLTLIDWIFRK
jgi:hypothetical protein